MDMREISVSTMARRGKARWPREMMNRGGIKEKRKFLGFCGNRMSLQEQSLRRKRGGGEEKIELGKG
jgi:hypothetical protein